MAKKEDVNNQENVSDVSQVIGQSDPSIVLHQEPAQMPVERQTQVHNVARDPNRALEPGRPFVTQAGLIGEMEKIIHDAEEKCEQDISASFHYLMNKIGEVLTHIHEFESKAADHVKPVYEKIITFFSK